MAVLGKESAHRRGPIPAHTWNVLSGLGFDCLFVIAVLHTMNCSFGHQTCLGLFQQPSSRRIFSSRCNWHPSAPIQSISQRRTPSVAATSSGRPIIILVASQVQGRNSRGRPAAAKLPNHLHTNVHRIKVHVQPASQSDEAFTEDQPGNVPEIANPLASGRTEASTYESPNGVPSQDDSIQSQIRETVTAVETTSSTASEQNTGVAHALHRQPVLSPVVDEYCQIMGNAVSWTGELLMQFLRIPLLPRGNRLINLRLDAHTDPSNAEK